MGTYRFFIVFLIAVTYAHVTFGDAATNSQYTLCATNECINSASEILSKLDRTVDPCDNFYKFACGGWLQNNRANQSFPKIDFFSVLTRKTANQLREMLEASNKPGDTMSLLKAKHVFAQCMEDSEPVGRSNLSAIVNSYGGWPIVMSHHDWNKKNLTWQDISTIIHEKQFDNGLYNIYVFIDSKMSNSNVIYILEPPFSASQDDIIKLNNTVSRNESANSDIVSFAKRLIEETGQIVEMDNLIQDALDMLQFEMELANLTSTEENLIDVDKYYIPLTIQQLQEEYDKKHPGMNGKIDWHSSIQEVFASEGIAIEPSEKIIVPAYKYLTNLVPLLERTPSRTIVNFMIWTVIKKFSDYIKPQKVNSIAIMNVVSEQSGENDTKWISCINKPNLKSAISHEYIKKYVSFENIQDIKEITTDIKDAIRQQIQNVTWMDEPTRVASLEKLEYMRHEFFKPDWYSDEAIDGYYEDLNITMGYLDNIINILKFERKKRINLLRTPADKKQWFFEPTNPQAYYSQYINKIVFTAALLQNPLYDRNRVALMNYGTLGFCAGHEMNHAFDHMYRKHDKNGNAIKWWTQKTIDEYEIITQCFIDQYNEYLVPNLEDIRVNGRRTLGENIGDSAGIVAAYYAYKNRKARLNETKWRLQGLEDYSEDQIFFLSAAQLFCETAMPEQIKESVSDEHPGNEIRIRGSFSNFREFSKIYNCSPEKPMNPENKCALWY
ncbi:neprilysin-like [Pseudomyrmex gracilis]|uniref:neprilysin-like n=1 Tax=Pseudomyrmex gracilis TaxID=219809 RepID=UPI00099583EF|nr:neprilysin-like [Pseudomyrmex gracilis]XP_020278780.1 neprilysin-like [Pseudomyrmex gracilis]